MVDKNKKISFAVEDVRIIDERNDSQFAEVQIDVFASGPNRHDMFVSVDTLKRTAKTILMKPLVYVYDKIFDDIGTHSELEVPGGLVPADSPIEYRELEDGRTMMTIFGRIWKRYSGDLLSFFQRDNNVKPVSVEMEVFETTERPDGLVELLDFCYTAITILGSLVTPAIPDAKMSVVKFAKEYEEDYKKEFSHSKYDELDLAIPETVKASVEKALSLHRKHGRGASAVILAHARHMQKNTHVAPERVRSMAKLLKSYASKEIAEDEENPSNEYISYLALGGKDGYKWASELGKKIEEIDSRKLSYFNDAGQDDKGEKEVNTFMEDEQKKVEEEKQEEEEKKEEMAAETKEEEKQEDPKEEEKETPEEEKKEEKMSLDAYLDVSAMLAMLEGETENYRSMVEAEFAKPEGEQNHFAVMGAMFSKMQKMQEFCNRMSAEKEDAEKKFAEKEEFCNKMSAEFEALKQFKAQVEQERFNYEVVTTMSEVKESMPKEEFEALQEKSKEFSLETVDAFKNLARAKAFQFSKGKKNDGDGVMRYALPFTGQEGKNKTGSSWDRLAQ